MARRARTIVIVGVLGCASAARGSGDGLDVFEWGMDRQGADYREFVPEAPDPTLCRDACREEARCRAWTYVKEDTVKGGTPRCYLKSYGPAAEKNPATVCGVKRGAPP